MIVPLKYLSSCCRTLEMLLINCEINIVLTRSTNYFIVAGTAANQVPTCAIADTKLYVPVVTLSTKGNAKLLQQLKSGFKPTISWNKYQSKASIPRREQC